MVNMFYWYCEYRKYNKEFAKKLNIKRDRKFEHFILFGWGRRNEERFKENCRGFLAYYEKRDLCLSFEAMNQIVCRIMATYMIVGDNEVLELEQRNFTNVFCESYVRKKIKELKSDTFIHKQTISNVEAVV